LFEDDPIEFIRRDLEGSDSDTRRRSATDLVRSLAELFEARLTALFGGYVNHYLQSYQANPSKNWKDKDTAIYLLIAITARTATAQLGATKTNENINIVDIFTNHILPDLQSPINSGTPHPVVRVDAIKFLNTFRHQLSKEQLISVFPLIVAHLAYPNYVVHTYGAVCIERILFMKQGSQLIFSSADLQPFTQVLLTHLFQLIEAGQSPEKISENYYLMKSTSIHLYTP
jgi:exportin-2 (importin alpha re-exporter)